MKMDEEEDGVLFILNNHLWLLVLGFKRLFLPPLGFLYFPVAERTLSKQSASMLSGLKSDSLWPDWRLLWLSRACVSPLLAL